MKTAKILISLAITLTALTACELETPSNGDLDGMWQLKEVDTMRTSAKEDVRERGIYWMVQAKLLEVKRKDQYSVKYFFRFEKKDGKLTLSKPYLDNRVIGDSLITDPTCLNYFGIYHLEERFNIEKLNGNEMILKSDSLRLTFRKY